MQALTKGQLNYILDQLYDNETQVIFSDRIQVIFDKYGDGYHKNSSWAPFTLTEENPCWVNGRGKFSWIPIADNI